MPVSGNDWQLPVMLCSVRGVINPPPTFGPTVPARRLREALGLSLSAVAERMAAAGYPMTPTAISRIETGKRGGQPGALRAYAAALNLQPYEVARSASVRSYSDRGAA